MTDREKKAEQGADSDDTMPIDEGTSAIEWVTAAVGAVLFIAMIGYMVYVGLRDVQGSPKIELTTSDPVQRDDNFHVGFVATNSGEVTATGLVVRAVLTDGDRDVESQEVTIDYLPTQSSRRGGFFFKQDPTRYKLAVTATAYMEP